MNTQLALQDIEIREREFALVQRELKPYAISQIMPQTFRDMGSLMILEKVAKRLNMDMIFLAQGMFMVHGKFGMSGQLITALMNNSGRLEKGIRWEVENEGTPEWRVRAYGTMFGDDLYTEWIDQKMVNLAGWGKNSKWREIPIRMAKYRSATFFARDYLPEILMGFKSVDEITDIAVSEPEVETAQSTLNMAISQEIRETEDKEVIEVIEENMEQPQIDPDISPLDEMKAQADSLGVRYRKDIGIETLERKIRDQIEQDSNTLLTDEEPEDHDHLEEIPKMDEIIETEETA